MPAMRIVKANVSGKCNPTSTKGRSCWKSSSENYLLIAEVRFRVRFRFRVMGYGFQKPFSTRTTFGGCRIASSNISSIGPSSERNMTKGLHLKH